MFPIIPIIVTLLLVGLCLYLLTLIPGIDPTIMAIIRIVVIIFAVLYVCNALGLFAGGAGWGWGHSPAPCR